MFDRRKDNQGIWTPTCLKNYHPKIFQQILEEGASQLQFNNNEVNIESDSDDISELTTLSDTEHKTWHPIIPHNGEWLYNQTEMQQKMHPDKQSTKTKERPWTMSASAQSFVPQCSVQESQPSHNTTKT